MTNGESNKPDAAPAATVSDDVNVAKLKGNTVDTTRGSETMTIGKFAEVYRVHVRKDGCGEAIIPGKRRLPDERRKRIEYASHIYEHGDGRFGVLFFFSTRRRWNFTKRRLAAAGFEIRQDGGTEGTALFDPSNAAQAGLAIKLARIRRRLELTQEQRQKLRDRLANARGLRNRPENPPVQAKFSTQAETRA